MIATEVDIIWIDKETTGLSPTKDNPLELGAVATTWSGDVISDFQEIIWYPGWRSKLEREPFVLEMHKKSGLFDELLELEKHGHRDWHSTQAVEERFLSWVNSILPPLEDGDWSRQYPMAGASVHFDRAFMKVHMSKAEAWFHYGNFDISSIRVLAAGANPAVREAEPEVEQCHRVIPDLKDTIRLYQYYLANLVRVDAQADRAFRTMRRDAVAK